MECFDELSLRRQLQALPSWKWVAFMLLCCERMLPNFERFSMDAGIGNGSALRAGLVSAWRWLETGQLPLDLNDLRNACEDQAPNTEDFHSNFTSSALDAANATAILLDALERPSASMAVEVAGLCRDTIDLYVQAVRHLDPNGPTFEVDILADPLMQTELRRQRDDLGTLIALGEDRPLAVKKMRERADQYAAGSLSN